MQNQVNRACYLWASGSRTKDKTESRGTLALRRELHVNPPSSLGSISSLSTSIFSDESRWMGREEEWRLRTRTEEFPDLQATWLWRLRVAIFNDHFCVRDTCTYKERLCLVYQIIYLS